jgi:hypothetical protein
LFYLVIVWIGIDWPELCVDYSANRKSIYFIEARKMKNFHNLTILILSLVGLVASVLAFSIQFSPPGTPASFNSPAQSSSTFGGITVDAFTYSAGAYTASQLWFRNEAPNDVGLGVCSEGTACGSPGGTGNGDYNELSNETNFEIIRLALPTNMVWSDLFVSSLDTGGSNNNESGMLYWSNSATPLLSSLSGLAFSHNTLNADTGSIWSLIPASFNPSDTYLFFTANASNGSNNDYLVWGANVVQHVPEPAPYTLLLAGLGLIGFMARRKQVFTA